MRKILFSFLLFVLIFLSSFKNTFAIYDPLSVPNNKFGIHIQSENDLTNAANLVNSNGGDWGYVTFVITEGERDKNRWQRVFDEARRKHLIPIVRIATKVNGSFWEKPREEEINNWIAFLNSLNWVVKNRYIVVSNEPNHAKEWGGEVNPEEYAKYLKTFSEGLKGASPDFFVLPAGLDASAPNSRITMDEEIYLRRMLKEVPDLFGHVDGWTSHSYPNPGFSGSETARGKMSVGGFDWELGFLRSLGITKSLPVFITETGWSRENTSEEEIGRRMESSFKNIWNDQRVVAVTPFILNYPDYPFDMFSWQKKEGGFYSFYNQIASIQKEAGKPVQEVSGRILGVFINPFMITESSFNAVLLTENLGQSIWVYPDVMVTMEDEIIAIETEEFEPVEPHGIRLIYIKGVAPKEPGSYSTSLTLKPEGKAISPGYPVEINVIRPSELKKLGIFAKIQIYLLKLVNLGP